MKVVILCGGLGTRLREETEFKPKPMVNIGDKPVLWHIMKYYSCFGFKDFVLCLGYKGEVIKDYFYNYEMMNNDFTIKLGNPKNVTFLQSDSENDWTVTLINTGEKTLKGARLKKIEKYIDTDNFMVTYGDGLSNVDLNKLIDFHKAHEKTVTVTGVNAVSRFGELKIKDDFKVEDFHEKPDNISRFINGGFFVLNKSIFNYLTEDENCDLEIGTFDL
ncbi:MAG: sugar phosphate nucleotidyltransferase, partial [Candidatus Sericytochromatia bacterium]